MTRKLTRSTRAGAIALLAATGMLLSACSDSGDNNADSTENSSSAASDNEGGSESGTVTIEDNAGKHDIKTPPERVVVTDNRSFEILASWGITPVAAPLPLVPDTVTEWEGKDVIDLGTHREPNLEALVEADPDLIISGQRFTRFDEEMKQLAPNATLIDLEPREGEELGSEFERQVTALGEIFGKEAEAKQMIDDYNKALERAREAYDGESTVMAVNVSGGEIGYVAPSVGRTLGPIFDLLDLKPALEVEQKSDNHEGDDISVEAIAESNPDWLFVLDRDGAINADKPEYTPAKDVLAKSEALKNVTAIKDDHIVLAPADTYVNENLITYTEILNLIADAFDNANK